MGNEGSTESGNSDNSHDNSKSDTKSSNRIQMCRFVGYVSCKYESGNHLMRTQVVSTFLSSLILSLVCLKILS